MIRSMLVFLFLHVIGGAAQGQLWDGCVARGESVRTVYDARASGPASAEDGKIIINPIKMRSFSRNHQKFIYWHECGHIVLEHQNVTRLQEEEADCFALRVMMTKWRFARRRVAQIAREMSMLPGDWAHLPGPERAEHLLKCEADTGKGTVQQRRRRY